MVFIGELGKKQKELKGIGNQDNQLGGEIGHW